MRIAVYKRDIEVKNGKEKLYRDIRIERNPKSVEEAEEIAMQSFENCKSYYAAFPERKYNTVGIDFKFKDLDTKEVIKTFQMRF